MLLYRLEDYDNAYANAPNVVGGDKYADKWRDAAAAFRAQFPPARLERIAYGGHARQTLDLFLPDRAPRGLVVFVHGGYWLRNDGAMFSHFAAGPLAHGFAVAIPTYRLCPEARIGEITGDIAAAVAEAAARVAGPVHLAGHSAGGHLVTRMICADSPLPAPLLARIARVVSISGVHDLRPLLHTAMRPSLRLDTEEARRESPALLEPMAGAKLVCWVGGGERAEFRRQNALLASLWLGLGAATAAHEEPDRHHFDIVEPLAQAESGLTRTLCEG